MKIPKIPKNPFQNLSLPLLCPAAVGYLRFVAAVFTGAGLVCAGLYGGVFSFVDSIHAYILATELYHPMIRTLSVATLMTLLIDLRAPQNE